MTLLLLYTIRWCNVYISVLFYLDIWWNFGKADFSLAKKRHHLKYLTPSFLTLENSYTPPPPLPERGRLNRAVTVFMFLFVPQLDNMSERLHQEAESRSRVELTNKQQQQGSSMGHCYKLSSPTNLGIWRTVVDLSCKRVSHLVGFPSAIGWSQFIVSIYEYSFPPERLFIDFP